MDWKERFLKAAWIAGYRTVDLQGVSGPNAVTLAELVDFAKSGYTAVTPEIEWSNLADHLRGLTALGCQAVAISVDPGHGYTWTQGPADPSTAILIARVAPDQNLELEEARNYFWAMAKWLVTLEYILPTIKLSDEERTRTQAIVGQLGGVLGAPAGLLSALLGALDTAAPNGICQTLHVVSQANNEYREAWAGSGMYDDRGYNHFDSVNTLWMTESDELTSVRPWERDEWLQRLLRSVVA